MLSKIKYNSLKRWMNAIARGIAWMFYPSLVKRDYKFMNLETNKDAIEYDQRMNASDWEAVCKDQLWAIHHFDKEHVNYPETLETKRYLYDHWF